MIVWGLWAVVIHVGLIAKRNAPIACMDSCKNICFDQHLEGYIALERSTPLGANCSVVYGRSSSHRRVEMQWAMLVAKYIYLHGSCLYRIIPMIQILRVTQNIHTWNSDEKWTEQAQIYKWKTELVAYFLCVHLRSIFSLPLGRWACILKSMPVSSLPTLAAQ